MIWLTLALTITSHHPWLQYTLKSETALFLEKSLGHWRTTVISIKIARSLLEMLHQVKINQMSNRKFTERLWNYCKYGSHGELEDYFRLVWTPNFIASVIKEVTAHLKRNLQIKNGDCVSEWPGRHLLFCLSSNKSKTCSLLTTSRTSPGQKVLRERNFGRQKNSKIYLEPALFNRRRLSTETTSL